MVKGLIPKNHILSSVCGRRSRLHSGYQCHTADAAAY